MSAILVMPEGGVGYYVNWWRGGARKAAKSVAKAAGTAKRKSAALKKSVTKKAPARKAAAKKAATKRPAARKTAKKAAKKTSR